MTTWMWAILLKPIFTAAIFFLVIAPITWLLYRMFPEGRLKVFLFKVRTGPTATRRDDVVYTLWAIGLHAGLVAFIALVIAG